MLPEPVFAVGLYEVVDTRILPALRRPQQHNVALPFQQQLHQLGLSLHVAAVVEPVQRLAFAVEGFDHHQAAVVDLDQGG
ncbi:hypothetical protein D3C80_1330230 [compost metagenome]